MIYVVVRLCITNPAHFFCRNRRAFWNVDIYIYICVYDWTDDTTTFNLDDRFPSVQSPPNCISSSIYSSKQTSKKNVRSKYQTANRPSSLPPSRHSSSLNENISKEVKQRRRYASDSNTNNEKTTPTLLVTSFLQYLRNELRVTTSDKKNDYQRHIRQVRMNKNGQHFFFFF